MGGNRSWNGCLIGVKTKGGRPNPWSLVAGKRSRNGLTFTETVRLGGCVCRNDICFRNTISNTNIAIAKLMMA